MTLIQKINPLNKEEEKKKFFFDPNYNPQFVYAEKITPKELLKYSAISSEYLPTAIKILEHIKKKYESHEKYLETIREPLLSQEEVEKEIGSYLEKEGLSKIVKVIFSSQTIARTSMYQNTITIRLPIEFTQSSLLGMLYHEIGTHQFRSMNDRKQLWYGKQHEFKMTPYFTTEEGLAVLHALIPRVQDDRLLRKQAINYFCVEYASKHSFSELFTALKEYVPDLSKRWDYCVRVKRGITDTSLPGAFSKDQTYFKGAIEVWKWLREHNHDATPLYIGKVALEDVERLQHFSNVQPLLIPTFLTANPEQYAKAIDEIGKINFFEK